MPLWLMQHHQRGQERYAKGQDYEGNLVFFFLKKILEGINKKLTRRGRSIQQNDA